MQFTSISIRILPLVFFSIVFGTLLVFAPRARAVGIISSGGANVVLDKKGEKAVLLDLYLDPKFKKIRKTFTLRENALRILSLKKEGKNHFRFALFDHFPLQNAISKRLDLWRPHARELVAAIEQVQAVTEFIAVPGELPPVETNYWLPTKLDHPKFRSQLRNVAYFDKKYGAVFSLHYLSKLDDLSFVSAIVHESLREIQITFQEQFPNQLLQEITARMMLSEPEKEPGKTKPLIDPLQWGDFLRGLQNSLGEPMKKVRTKVCAEFRATFLGERESIDTLYKRECEATEGILEILGGTFSDIPGFRPLVNHGIFARMKESLSAIAETELKTQGAITHRNLIAKIEDFKKVLDQAIEENKQSYTYSILPLLLQLRRQRYAFPDFEKDPAFANSLNVPAEKN